MKIRKATIKDESQVINLLKQFPSEEVTIDWRAAALIFSQIIENPDLGTILLAEEDGDVVGVITLSYPTAIRCGGPYCCIEEFIVSDRARGIGVGGQLLRGAIAEATSKGCYEIQINNPSELGYPVYLRHGLKDIGKHMKMKLQHQN